MRKQAGLAEAIVSSLDADEISEAFGAPPCQDLREWLIDWLQKDQNASVDSIAKSLGRPLVRKLLRSLGVDVDMSAPCEALVQAWLEQQELALLVPAPRPQELAGTLCELAAQIGTTPGKFDFVDALAGRCALLLRYVALFYADRSIDLDELARMLEKLPLDRLCAHICVDAPLPRQPYQPGASREITLGGQRVREALAALPLLVGDVPEGVRMSRAKEMSDRVLDLLGEWHLRPTPSLIPKGAVIDELVLSASERRAACYDEFGLRVALTGIRHAMIDGDSILLAAARLESVAAAGLKPLPRRDGWATPRRSSCGLVEPPRPSPRRRVGHRVFVSYAREDDVWVQRVRVHLASLLDDKRIELWDDGQIRTGESWPEWIETALRTSGMAVLVLSPDFFASAYICERELPALLKAAKEENAAILPLYVRPVQTELHAKVAALQAINSPTEPLACVAPEKRDEILNRLALEIKRRCDALASRS